MYISDIHIALYSIISVNAEDEEKTKCYQCSDDEKQREAKGLPKCSSDKSKWKICVAKECWNTTRGNVFI